MSKPDYTVGSSNVFADLDLPNPEERLLKAQLARAIDRAIEERGLSDEQEALRLGLEPAQLADLLHGRLAEFSTDRLLRLLAALGQDVRISIEPSARARGTVELVPSR